MSKCFAGCVKIIAEGGDTAANLLSSWYLYVTVLLLIGSGAFWIIRLNRALVTYDPILIIPMLQVVATQLPPDRRSSSIRLCFLLAAQDGASWLPRIPRLLLPSTAPSPSLIHSAAPAPARMHRASSSSAPPSPAASIFRSSRHSPPPTPSSSPLAS